MSTHLSKQNRSIGMQPSRSGSGRSGLTLIEIMIALTMTLIVLGAMMTAFQFASEEMKLGRAVMELANRARAAENLLRSDLSNLTVEPRPYTQTTSPNGYFEYIEGPLNDGSYTTNGPDAYRNFLGDFDDVLCMTVRGRGRAFRGRTGQAALWSLSAQAKIAVGAIQESPLAEIVWFTTFVDVSLDGEVDFEESVKIHRRVLLIRPDLGLIADELVATDVEIFFQTNDISARIVPGNDATHFDLIANDLTDLARRENRFCHIPFGANFPNALQHTGATGSLVSRRIPEGDDIVLTDVAAFDVRVYSPNGKVERDATINTIIEPGDTGASTAPGDVLGTFVDLSPVNTLAAPLPWFYGAAHAKSQLVRVYDTWTPSYESDGFNQDSIFDTGSPKPIDEGTDGIDNDNANGVDDNGERETFPPYPYPIRGLEVKIRLIEKSTKQVHQNTIKQSFVPE